MYFNAAGLAVPIAANGNARIDFINGDLSSLTLAAGFLALKPRSSGRIEYLATDSVVNITDGPKGFYLVWDTDPEKGYTIGAFYRASFKSNLSRTCFTLDHLQTK